MGILTSVPFILTVVLDNLFAIYSDQMESARGGIVNGELCSSYPFALGAPPNTFQDLL
jgi:hypothetical protein